MTQSSPPDGETGFDAVLSFTIPDRDTRGRAVRLGPVLDIILSAHNYPPAVARILAEALVLTALMGSLLKGEGDQMTMQAQAQGGLIRLLACDYRDGELRGYAEVEDGSVGNDVENMTLGQLFGSGHLAITFEVAGSGQRYQGIVPLGATTLSDAVEQYFVQSEQVPTLVRTAIGIEGDSNIAAGVLLQHLPQGEAGRERLHVQLDHPHWEHVAVLASSIRDTELVDPDLSLEDLVWRLFHEESEVRVERGSTLTRGCRCSILHFENVLARFPKEDRREMANDDGIILVDCAFCSKEFAIQD